MKCWYLCLIVLLLLPLAYAQDTNIQSEKTMSGASSVGDVVPPPVNNGETPINIFLYASDTRELMLAHHLEYELINPDNEDSEKYLFYVESGFLSLSPSFEDFIIILKADLMTSPGKDYYGEGRVSSNGSISLFPVGSVRGEIVNADGEMVRNADIKFSCSGQYGVVEMLKSDGFGSFSADWLPVGTCKIYSTKNNYVGFVDIDITQGQLSTVELVLSKDLQPISYIKFVIWGFLFLLVVVVIVIYFQNRNLSKNKIPAEVYELPDESNKSKLDARMNDLMETLNEKERLVIDYLLKKNCEVNQSLIRHEYKIPKTTLTRLLESLERKKFIDIKKVGKVRKVCLTDFFKGN